ncbi:DUF1353 domain-containing protein [Pararhodobacter sp. CCB-MM2]|uniref:DUF1353 domain-containing protein n=1 Tax=Pararhodobacter sp. CCB-MM2 TaxID=1786003 RepID=UPI00082D6D61|nr:DUF1353 domain-containing protein [Pararhodobacter sp. CCB-MM2]
MTYPTYDQTPVGRFENAEDLMPLLSPENADGWYLYTPRAGRPMRFHRHDGSVIEPGRFLTDLGTIPKIFRIGRLMQPDSYPAVALLHDWIVRQQNCRTVTREFGDSILIQQEALKTWMESHPQDRSRLVFLLTRIGLTSGRSRDGWEVEFNPCPPSLETLLATQKDLNRCRFWRRR